MERRTFVKGAFGLVALAAAASVFDQPASDVWPARQPGFVTPEVASPESAEGPVMVPGISLVEREADSGTVDGYYGDTHLFSVDARGAQLIRLADGDLTIDDLAAALEPTGSPADVASFFVTLGQAGYLRNTVLVNLVEIPA